MSAKGFLQKLAIERCQHHLAQICAMIRLKSISGEEEDLQAEAMRLLVETMNRDLEFMEKTLGFLFENSSSEANLCE